MKRYYLGLREDGRWEVFEWDERNEPTEDDTGYSQHQGPYETADEAREYID